MKTTLASTVIAAALTSASLALTASDSSTNYTTATWTNGANQGTGFGVWTLTAANGGGRYVGPTGLSASSFGIFAGSAATNPLAYSSANRAFSAPMSIGDIFTVQIGYTGVAAPGGEIGMNLFAPDVNPFRLGLKFIGGATNWVINDGGADFPTGIPWAGGSPGTTLNVSFTYNGANGYDITLNQGANSFIGTNYVSTSGMMNINNVEFYSSAQGGSENMGFDNLNVVPEPSTYALLGVSAVALAGYVIRRRRS